MSASSSKLTNEPNLLFDEKSNLPDILLNKPSLGFVFTKYLVFNNLLEIISAIKKIKIRDHYSNDISIEDEQKISSELNAIFDNIGPRVQPAIIIEKQLQNYWGVSLINAGSSNQLHLSYLVIPEKTDATGITLKSTDEEKRRNFLKDFKTKTEIFIDDEKGSAIDKLFDRILELNLSFNHLMQPKNNQHIKNNPLEAFSDINVLTFSILSHQKNKKPKTKEELLERLQSATKKIGLIPKNIKNNLPPEVKIEPQDLVIEDDPAKTHANKINETAEKLKLIYDHEQEKINKTNQQIYITDLLVIYPKTHSLGEFNKIQTSEKNIKPNIRMISHIRLLADIANQQHLSQNFTETETGSKFKNEESKNNVTRILLNEFALYTHEQPLTFDELAELLDQLKLMAREYPENLHLSMGTIALKSANQNSLNYGIYIECGPDPQIHCFSKSYAHELDPEYSKLTKFSKRQNREFSNELKRSVDQPVSMILPSNATDAGISFDAIFTSKTASGAQFTIFEEICYDHQLKRAIIAQQSKIQHALHNKKSEYFSLQTKQDIVSNSVDIYNAALLSKNITHADPEFNTSSINLKDQAIQYVTQEQSDRFIKAPFHETSTQIQSYTRGTVVSNPDFAGDYGVYSYAPIPLSQTTHQPKIDELIELGNLKIQMNNTVNILKSSSGIEASVFNKAKARWEINVLSDRLQQYLLALQDTELPDLKNNATQLLLIGSDWEVETIEFLLEMGADINARDEQNNNLLHLAILANNEPLIRFYSTRINLNEMNIHKINPLQLAITVENNRVIQILMDAGSNLNLHRDQNLGLALEYKNHHLVKKILDETKGIGEDLYPLLLKAAHGFDAEMVTLLMSYGLVLNEDDLRVILREMVLKSASEKTLHYFLSLDTNRSRRIEEETKEESLKQQKKTVCRKERQNSILAAAIEINSTNLINKHLNTKNQDDIYSAFLIALGCNNKAVFEKLWDLLKPPPSIGDINRFNIFHNAVISNSIKLVTAIADSHPTIINAPAAPGIKPLHFENLPPLHITAHLNHSEIMQTLLERKANLNTYGRELKTTPLMIAALNHPELIPLLASFGADIRLKDQFQQKAISYAPDINAIKMIVLYYPKELRKLKDYTFDLALAVEVQKLFLRLPLSLAIELNQPREIKKILREKKHNLIPYLNSLDPFRKTPLHWAAEFNNSIAVELLKAASLNTPDHLENTPLHIAAKKGHFEVIAKMSEMPDFAKVLIKPNREGKTPLGILYHYYRYHPSYEIMMNHPEVKKAKFLALEQALIQKNYQSMLNIIKLGIDLNSKNAAGHTLLHIALEKKNIHAVEILLKYGATPTEQEKEIIKKMDALKIQLLNAVAQNELKTVTDLLLNVSLLDTHDDNGSTPLHIAVKKNLPAMVALLRLNGANPHAPDALNNSPIYYAFKNPADVTKIHLPASDDALFPVLFRILNERLKAISEMKLTADDFQVIKLIDDLITKTIRVRESKITPDQRKNINILQDQCQAHKNEMIGELTKSALIKNIQATSLITEEKNKLIEYVNSTSGNMIALGVEYSPLIINNLDIHVQAAILSAELKDEKLFIKSIKSAQMNLGATFKLAARETTLFEMACKKGFVEAANLLIMQKADRFHPKNEAFNDLIDNLFSYEMNDAFDQSQKELHYSKYFAILKIIKINKHDLTVFKEIEKNAEQSLTPERLLKFKDKLSDIGIIAYSKHSLGIIGNEFKDTELKEIQSICDNPSPRLKSCSRELFPQTKSPHLILATLFASTTEQRFTTFLNQHIINNEIMHKKKNLFFIIVLIISFEFTNLLRTMTKEINISRDNQPANPFSMSKEHFNELFNEALKYSVDVFLTRNKSCIPQIIGFSSQQTQILTTLIQKRNPAEEEWRIILDAFEKNTEKEKLLNQIYLQAMSKPTPSLYGPSSPAIFGSSSLASPTSSLSSSSPMSPASSVSLNSPTSPLSPSSPSPAATPASSASASSSASSAPTTTPLKKSPK